MLEAKLQKKTKESNETSGVELNKSFVDSLLDMTELKCNDQFFFNFTAKKDVAKRETAP